MASATITVRVADMPEVKAHIEDLERRLKEAEAERDEWEQQYEWLLREVGGTAP